MMLPSQIKNYNFTSPKQGLYRSSDVDSFKQRVYAAYCELISENNALKEKFASLSDIVNEYNAGKNSIATALIKSQAYADETVKAAKKSAEELIAQAKAEADKIIETAKREADEYAAEKSAAADACLEKAEGELDRVKSMAAKEAEGYISQVNEKACEIIANANEQASTIVARAYLDVKKARETCDGIISETKDSLPEIRAKIVGFKAQTQKLLAIITQAVDSLTVPDTEVPDIAMDDTDSELKEYEPVSRDDIPVFSFGDHASEDEIVSSDTDSFEDEETTAEAALSENDTQAEPSDAPADSDYVFERFSTISNLFGDSVFDDDIADDADDSDFSE